MDAFRQLTDKLGYTLNDNYRPIYPLGARLLRKYGPYEGNEGGGDASEDGSGNKHRTSQLNLIDADFVKHDHDHDHDIFFDASHYARPDIKEILDEEDVPAPRPNVIDSTDVLRRKLEDCERERRRLTSAGSSSLSPVGVWATMTTLLVSLQLAVASTLGKLL